MKKLKLKWIYIVFILTKVIQSQENKAVCLKISLLTSYVVEILFLQNNL